MVGTSISTSSLTGSLRNTTVPENESSASWPADRKACRLSCLPGYCGLIKSMSAWQGTITSILVRNFSRLVGFWWLRHARSWFEITAVDSSLSVNPSSLPPINPVLACDSKAIVGKKDVFFQSFLNPPKPTKAYQYRIIIKNASNTFSQCRNRGCRKKHFTPNSKQYTVLLALQRISDNTPKTPKSSRPIR